MTGRLRVWVAFGFVIAGCLQALPPGSFDQLRLDSETDRAAFRRWFAFLAEAQYFTPPKQRPSEIVDCSSLVRYAYREALRKHDTGWAAQSGLPLVPAIPSVTKYNYPHTPMGPKLFRTGPDGFGEFADAATLYRFNVFFISRDLASAGRGDLLFFRQAATGNPFHTIIVLRSSQITADASLYVVYDTGPDGAATGEIKRLSFTELLGFPDPRWRPIPENRAFLGVFRWNILKENT